MKVEVRDDSDQYIDQLEVENQQEVEDLQDQLPEGWSVEILDDLVCENCGTEDDFEYESFPSYGLGSAIIERRCRGCDHTVVTETEPTED